MLVIFARLTYCSRNHMYYHQYCTHYNVDSNPYNIFFVSLKDHFCVLRIVFITRENLQER